MFRYITLHKILYWILLSMDTLCPNLFCTLICISFFVGFDCGHHHHHHHYRVAVLDIGMFCCNWVLPVVWTVACLVMQVVWKVIHHIVCKVAYLPIQVL